MPFNPFSEIDITSCITSFAAEIVAEFLNAMIDTELPIEGLIVLTEFLELTDVSTRAPKGERVERQGLYRSQIQREIDMIRASFIEAYKLTGVCQTSLMRAESNTLLADRLLRAKPERSTETPITHFFNVPSPALSSRLHNAIHDALMDVMAERDQSRAKFFAADELHVRELQQERKKNLLLAEELESKTLAASKTDSNAAAVRKRKQEQEANNDTELMMLCQHLSSEIAARTSATLEIERLREMRETERSNEALEKESLQQEIRTLKEQLENERNAAVDAREASSAWQRSFEAVMEFHKENPASPS